jgi:peptide/nickel transport system permease protein
LEQVALAGLLALTLVAMFAPLLAPYDPLLRVESAFQPPSWAHPFGTDEIGRDLLSRVIYGIRLTWLPSLGVIGIGIIIGSTLGLIAGASDGWVDGVLQRLTDLFLVLPSTLIALAVVAALGRGLFNTLVAISIFWWPWYSRIVRGEIKAIAAQSHVEAARLAGVSRWRLFTRYLLPGAIPAVLVTATLDVANIILVLSLFSFLGLGAPAPAPELGAMTARTLDSLTAFWWLPVLPALVIFLLALTANLAGDGLRDVLKSV